MNKISLIILYLINCALISYGQNCETIKSISQPITTSVIHGAAINLVASSSISGVNSVQFTAGTNMVFNPSFTVTASGNSSFLAKIEGCSPSLTPNPGALFSTSNFTKTVNTSLPVGTIAASADVDLSGSATYTIPIAVPPGTNGVAPQIALSYNSAGSNGMIGQGWNLVGLSSISRVPKDIYHDGTSNDIAMNNNDALVLDGNRLVLTGGTHLTAGATYATELETFSIIEIINSSSTNQIAFKVTSKNGMISEYGMTFNDIAYVLSTNVPYSWRLNKVTYLDGNYIEYKNETFTDHPRIAEILYTGNANAGIVPYNKITFSYVTRSDNNIVYVAGNAITNSYLLDNINITDENNNLVKNYQLKYGWDNINSFLNEIFEKGSDGTALNSTIFKYGDYPGILERYTTSVTGIQDGIYFSGDFNGDGFSDVLEANSLLSPDNTVQYTTQVKIYKTIPAVNQASTFSAPVVKNLAGNFSLQKKKSIPDIYTFITNDFTGDGIDDIGTVKTTGTGATWALNFVRIFKGSSTLTALSDSITIDAYTGYSRINSNTGHYLFPGDYNGDGVGDLITVLGATGNPAIIGIHLYLGNISSGFGTLGTIGTINIPVNNWQSADRIQVFDFNGDGKSDLMITKDNYSEIFTIDGYQIRSIYYAGFPTKFHLPFFGDFNGDHKIDILCRTSTTDNLAQWYKCLSTGTTFDQTLFSFTTRPTINSSYAGDKILLMDCNGDGKTDIFHGILGTGASTIYHTYFSRGNSFYYYLYPGTTTNLTNLNTVPLTPFDFNGDGKPEIFARTNYTSFFDIIHFMPWGQELFLDKVKNGFDHNTQWVYKRINRASTPQNNGFYTRGAVLTGKVNNIQLPITLASDLIVDNGIGSTNTTSYSYEEAKLHKEGRGLMGFLKVNNYNQTTGFKTTLENEFNTTYYTAAPKISTLIYVPNSNQIMNTTTNTNEWVSTGLGRFYRRTNSIAENKYFEGQTVNTTNTYDSYSNITSQVVDNNSVETTTITTAFGQYSTPVPSLPTSITTSTTRSGQSPYSRTTAINYNSIGQVTSKIDFYGLPKAVTTSYTYNSLGNQTSAVVSASGIVTRTLFSSLFDSKGRWAESNTTPLGTSSATYHASWGRPLSMTDVTGLKSTYTYDNFGREISMTTPQLFTINTSYQFTTSYGARYLKQISHPGKPDVKIYYDVLDRERRTETEGWQNLWITTEKTYNQFGEVATTTGPYKYGETGLLTTYNYDGYRRPSSVVENKSGTNYTTSIGYTYSGGELTTTTTNPASQVSSTITDASGKTKSATDYGGTLSYTYFSHGGLKTVANGATTLVNNSFDAYARQTSMVDINAGTTSYDYDALGQLISQINAKGQTQTMTYDLAGRMLTKTMPEGTTAYEYFSTNAGTSTSKLKKITGFASDIEEYTYDSYARPASLVQTVDGTAHTKSFTYNTYDDLLSVTYPSGFGLNYTYDANGYLSTIKNGTNTTTLFTNGTMNGYNQYKTYTLGNTKSSTNTYFFGMPTNYVTAGVQNLSLNWNYTTNNLTSRVDGIVTKTESFTYDNLNRLTSSAITGLTTQNIAYAANGNITSKTDAGTYEYTHAKINAVTRINPSAGNISSGTQSLPTYTSFLQPASISEGTNMLAYTYGSDENRIKSALTQNSAVTNTRYYLGDYEKDITGSTTKHIHYISAGDGLMAIVIRENGTDTYYYTYTDHLGSILHVTNSTGMVTNNLNYDAWGRYRNSSTWAYTSVTAPPAWLTRGYTGHEHLPLFGIINMNGRLYDPVVGRMLAVDNNVQAVGLTQNYNRYSYALNNPLKYTDPDGEFIFLIPQISFSGKGGLSLGLEIGVGVPGVLSASVTGGYNFKIKNGYGSIQGSALGLYAGYGTQGGFAGIGYRYASFSAGIGYGSSGYNVGVSYGGSSNNLNGSIGIGWSEKEGFDWNVSLASTYMWGTVTPGSTNERGNQNSSSSNSSQIVGNVGLYSDETLAYNVMVEQTQFKGVETSSWILDQGILMMPIETPTYKNTATSSENNYYKVTVSGKKFFVNYNGSRYKINGQIHTHPRGNSGLSTEDFSVVHQINNKVYTIGSNKVHYGNPGSLNNSWLFGYTRHLLNGSLTIIKK